MMTSARISDRLQQMTAERCGSIPGAYDMYFVGDFDENGASSRFSRSGSFRITSQSYAAQTYYYEPGKPVIRFA